MRKGSVIVGPAFGTRYVVKRGEEESKRGDAVTIEPEGGGVPETWTIRGLERCGYKLP